MKRATIALSVTAAFALLLVAAVAFMAWGDGVDIHAPDAAHSPAQLAELAQRGAYLAHAGNCMACHTARGAPPYSGGRPLPTPYGTVYASNLTPDLDTGIGGWSAAAFWRALHHGRSADGRLLNPAFPYTHTTLITRDDAEALLTHLRSVPPVKNAVPPATLRWPYGTQPAIAAWRALYFEPGSFKPDAAQSPAWNRGAYLVRGLAHCSACHSPRGWLAGGDWNDLSGGALNGQGWYAPSLADPRQAGLQEFGVEEIVQLLKTGVTRNGAVTVSGPMAEVVVHGTQYLTDADLGAMATYLKALPVHDAAPRTARSAPPPAPAAGIKLYETHCADCHGKRGEGVPGAYPPLAGNRAVLMPQVDNLVQVLLFGGFGPATAGHPRPHGMPPFVQQLSDDQIALLLTTLRGSWGNQAGVVSSLDVLAARRSGGALSQTR